MNATDPRVAAAIRCCEEAAAKRADKPVEVVIDPRLHQLVALFKLCDERGKRTLMAMAGVQVSFAAGGM